MIKLLLGSALSWFFLTTALPAVLSDSVNKPAKMPARSDKKMPARSADGITQISFTRAVPWHGTLDTREYEEKVTFYGWLGDGARSYTVIRSVSALPNDADHAAQEELSSLYRGQGTPNGLEFFHLTKLLASAKFFEFKGDNTVTAAHSYALSPWITISAVRTGQPKPSSWMPIP